MKRLGLLAALVLIAAASARAADWRASDRVIAGGGRYYGDDFEAGVLFPSGRWDASVRAKSFQFRDAMSGVQAEYSGRLARKLPHVTVAGRLGTAAPNAQRLGYRLAGGEVLMTLYGLTVGPESTATIATVAEDTATAAALARLDTTWVTRFRGVYTNATFHLQRPPASGGDFRLVQNSLQFTVSETWKGRSTLALHGGQQRYSQTLHPFNAAFYHWNVDYEVAPTAVFGYENNYLGADLTQRIGDDWTVRAGFTRINMLFGSILVHAGGEAAWRPRGGPLELGAGWYGRRVLHAEARDLWSVAAAYRW